MDMKISPRRRVGIGQGFVREETPDVAKLEVRIRSGQEGRRGGYFGEPGKPVAFVWTDDEAETPTRELVVMVEKQGLFLWEEGTPVALGNLFPEDKALVRLQKQFEDWQRFFEKYYDPRTPNHFKWGVYHQEGRHLARKLQAALIDRAVIRYRRPEQDPQSGPSPEIAL